LPRRPRPRVVPARAVAACAPRRAGLGPSGRIRLSGCAGGAAAAACPGRVPASRSRRRGRAELDRHLRRRHPGPHRARAGAVPGPGLPPHRAVLAYAGLNVRGAPVDEEGVDVHGVSAPVVLATPAHQCPTGVVLSPRRRAALIAWARGGGLVIEDDYDAEFRYDRAPLGALQGLAPDRVVYLGTTSKTLAPGMRLGWLVVPRAP